MPGISPEEMAQMQADAGQENQEGGISKLVQDVGSGLNKLADALNNSQAATDKDRQQMAQIISSFTDLVEKNLGAAPGEDAQEAQMPGQGVISADGGPSGVPMGPQSRQ